MDQNVDRNITVAAMCHKYILKTQSLASGFTTSVRLTGEVCSKRNDAINWRQSVFNGQSRNELNGSTCSRDCKPTKRNTTVTAMCPMDILKTQSLLNGLTTSVRFTREVYSKRNDAINWRQSVFNGHSRNELNGLKCSGGSKLTKRNTTVAAMCQNDIIRTHSLVIGLSLSVNVTRKACLQRRDASN